MGAPTPRQHPPRPRQAPPHLAHGVPVHLLPDTVLQRPLAGRGAPPPPCSELGTAACTESHQGQVIAGKLAHVIQRHDENIVM